MKTHVTILGLIFIAYNIIGALLGVVIFIFFVGAGVASGEGEEAAILVGLATIVGGFLLATSLPGLLGGLGVIKHQGWARIVLLILGCLNLPAVPIGTTLGIYTLWVLTHEETTPLFRERRV